MRLLGRYTQPRCPACRRTPGIDCVDSSPSKRTRRNHEERQWRREAEDEMAEDRAAETACEETRAALSAAISSGDYLDPGEVDRVIDAYVRALAGKLSQWGQDGAARLSETWREPFYMYEDADRAADLILEECSDE